MYLSIDTPLSPAAARGPAFLLRQFSMQIHAPSCEVQGASWKMREMRGKMQGNFGEGGDLGGIGGIMRLVGEIAMNPPIRVRGDKGSLNPNNQSKGATGQLIMPEAAKKNRRAQERTARNRHKK